MKRYFLPLFSVLLCIAIFLIANIFRVPQKDVLSISFLNVGQGDATLVQKGDFQVLIDGGPSDSILPEMSKQMPPMDRKIELIILTHPHADHLVGINQVLDRYEVGEIISTGVIFSSLQYIEFLEKIKNKNITFSVPKIGDYREFATNATISFLWPGDQFVGKSVENINNTSLVTKVCYFQKCILSLGDLEKDEEEEMIKYYEKDNRQNVFKSEIIKVPHHGSNNALSPLLYEIAMPKIAIIMAGRDNQFGHPHQAVIDYLNKSSIKIFRTDQADGSIRFDLSADEVKNISGKLEKTPI